jgi:tRNA threonylcarbamoyladenosine biosynthesis protein TsaE
LRIAEQIGSRLKGGEVIQLVSDLGGGKTAFVRGLAKGMGSADTIHSPSFTISNQYKAGALTLHHYDFYRLKEAGIIRDELAEVVSDPNAVIAIEWANIVEDVLPEHIAITIKPTSESGRMLFMAIPESLSFVAKGLV